MKHELQERPKQWKNTKALITGGSAGLGRSLALELSRKGAKVAVIARSSARLLGLKAEYPAIQIIEGDVSLKEEIPYLASQALLTLGGLDLLVNGASTLGPKTLRLLADTACEDFESALQTNLLGPFRLTKALLAPMLLRRGGTVVNVTSDASVNSYARWGAYGASKAALDHLTATFAEELGAEGIRFYAIDPGDMDTELHRQALPDSDPRELRSPDESARRIVAFLEKDAPSGRIKV